MSHSVVCRVYSTNESSLNEQFLESFQHDINALTSDHIWHNDVPFFKLQKNAFVAVMNVADCILDEWIAIYCLFDVSSKYPDILISVEDDDGQPLLIQAAHVLPKWLQPETSSNRVWIYGGRIHLVTPDMKEKPSVSDALKLVTSRDADTLTPAEKIHDNIQQYLNDIVKPQWKENKHVVKAIVPRSVARIIALHPQWIARAVDVFYTRDSLSFKACHKMDNFTPDDSVLTSIDMTRMLYAKLKSQAISPTKPFQSSSIMPYISDTLSPFYEWADIGMKVAYGFEMLYTDPYFSDIAHGKATEYERDTQWKTYLHRLQTTGYFQEEKEGSKKYNELLAKSKKHYFESTVSSVSVNALPPLDSILASSQKLYPSSQDFDAFLESDGRWVEEGKWKSSSTEWLNVTEEEMDKMLQEKYNFSDGGLRNVVDRVQKFVEKMSSMEGVEMDSDDMQSASEKEDSDDEGDEDDADSDMEGFVKEMPELGHMDEKSRRYYVRMMKQMKALLGSEVDEILNSSSGEEDGLSSSEDEEVEEEDENLREVMESMRRELAETTLGSGMEKGSEGEVDIEKNLANNWLRGFKSQQGDTGPIGNLLQTLGKQDSE